MAQELDAANRVFVTHVAILSPQAHVANAQAVANVAQLFDDLGRCPHNHLVVVLRLLIRLAVERL